MAMAPSATNTDDTPTIGAEAISKPPAGVVLPPKDIRGSFVSRHTLYNIWLTEALAIVEKTAGYVARNGPVFEGHICRLPSPERAEGSSVTAG
jgi:splicing factor 3A subunit 1